MTESVSGPTLASKIRHGSLNTPMMMSYGKIEAIELAHVNYMLKRTIAFLLCLDIM